MGWEKCRNYREDWQREDVGEDVGIKTAEANRMIIIRLSPIETAVTGDIVNERVSNMETSLAIGKHDLEETAFVMSKEGRFQAQPQKPYWVKIDS